MQTLGLRHNYQFLICKISNFFHISVHASSDYYGRALAKTLLIMFNQTEKKHGKTSTWTILSVDHKGREKLPCCIGSAEKDSMKPICEQCELGCYSVLMGYGIKQ